MPLRGTQPDCHGISEMPPEGSATAFQGQQTMDALERLHGAPFSLTCSFHFPHSPMLPVRSYAEMYDPENMPFLARFKQAASLIILADSRVKHLGDEAYELKQTITCRTWPDLNEFEEFNQVRIYHADGKV